MLKFENINILEVLEKIVSTNTKYYQCDFESDKKILIETAQKAKELSPQDKIYLWMSRSHGTWCLKERNTFLKGSREYGIWTYYGEQTHDKILAYTVEVKTIKNKTVIGNLYQIDYQKHFKHVKEVCIPSNTILFYENGKFIIETQYIISFCFPPYILLGRFLRSEEQPSNFNDLEKLLNTEKNIREKFLSGNIQQHINKLICKAENPSTSYINK